MKSSTGDRECLCAKQIREAVNGKEAALDTVTMTLIISVGSSVNKIHLLLLAAGTYALKMDAKAQSELRTLAKVELHRHLECSMRLSTMQELIAAKGMEVPSEKQQFQQKYLVTSPMRDLGAVLNKFLVLQKILDSEAVLTRLTFECIEDAVSEGIKLLELRFAPTFIRQGHPHLSFDAIHRAIMAGVQKAQHLPIAVGLIVIVQRILPVSDAADVTDYAIAHKGDILALDLADNEVGFDSKPFAPHFQRAKAAGLHITVHAGEAPAITAGQSVMDAIELLGAERIGHGVQIQNHPAVVKFVRDHKIPLELCPTSNWLTNAVTSLSAHPFRKLMEAGVLVTINSDDPGIFAIDLPNEYRVLAEHLKIKRSEFEAVNDNAAASSFIPLKIKQKYWTRPIQKSAVGFSQ